AALYRRDRARPRHASPRRRGRRARAQRRRAGGYDRQRVDGRRAPPVEYLAMNLITELVVANRILANEDVVDAYGHVSVRNPEAPGRFFLAHSKSPALVEPADILEFNMDAEPLRSDPRPLYLERFIHAAIYEARPDVMAVVHAHAEDVL